MVDTIERDRRTANMSRIRSNNTKPEMVVRCLTHSMGYRFRLHRKDLPGKPDLVFPARRKVIFVHGCFWHQHPACREGRLPGTNQEYWTPKLGRNVERDLHAQESVRSLGWESLVIWECETTDPGVLSTRLKAYLG